jgi:hypothetical protein
LVLLEWSRIEGKSSAARLDYDDFSKYSIKLSTKEPSFLGSSKKKETREEERKKKEEKR